MKIISFRRAVKAGSGAVLFCSGPPKDGEMGRVGAEPRLQRSLNRDRRMAGTRSTCIWATRALWVGEQSCVARAQRDMGRETGLRAAVLGTRKASERTGAHVRLGVSGCVFRLGPPEPHPDRGDGETEEPFVRFVIFSASETAVRDGLSHRLFLGLSSNGRVSQSSTPSPKRTQTRRDWLKQTPPVGDPEDPGQIVSSAL
ncbi:hypothetical protein AAFF_G00352720 [Aldrovandia affinis]|uniref:Uncharacterized protein n=1 Tax=Aldrovandia affinis TaxID=143900 RepID=A0AAD7WNT1_9TELE|nr:hypothetical protein AAFF_G00352720 [Aldrovandia affinis]